MVISYLSLQYPRVSLFSANSVVSDCFLLGRAAELLLDTRRNCGRSEKSRCDVYSLTGQVVEITCVIGGGGDVKTALLMKNSP